MESIDEKIKNAIKILAESVNELFSKKTHTHTKENIGIDFSPVAFSGSYSDLTGTPQRQDIGFARSDKAGIVIPGNGLAVGNNGVLRAVTDSASGMFVSQNGIGINMGGGMYNDENRWCSVITIKSDNWSSLANGVCTMADKFNNSGMREGMRIAVMNTTSIIDNVMYITLTNNRIMHCSDIFGYVKQSLETVGADSLSIGDCCTDTDEVCSYEFLKLLSDEGIYDAAILYIFYNARFMGYGDMIKYLGMVAPDTVRIVEHENTRFDKVGIEPPGNIGKLAATYIYTRDGYRNIYNVLSGIYGKIDIIN